MKNAKLLVVRPDKIHAALVKLIEINPLYHDVVINDDVLSSLQPEGLAPVQIDLHSPSTAEEAQGSCYDECDVSRDTDGLNDSEDVGNADIDC